MNGTFLAQPPAATLAGGFFMPRTYGLDLVRAFVRSAATDVHPIVPHVAPTVTVSRDAGSGGEKIARLLASQLDVRCLDGELLDSIAAEIHGDKNALARVDERVRTVSGQVLYNFFTQQSADATIYQLHLIHILLDVPDHGGGVIVGRGAHLVIPQRRAFRVRICGSASVCADRLQEQEGLSHESARDTVQEINRERADFIRERYGHDPADLSAFDLVVNTDRLEQQAAVRIILYAMHLAGFKLPGKALSHVSLIEQPQHA
jgi:cytidylate kinase